MAAAAGAAHVSFLAGGAGDGDHLLVRQLLRLAPELLPARRGGGGTAVGHSTASSNQAVWSPPINSPPLEWSPMGLLCTSIKILTHTGNTHERGGGWHTGRCCGR